LPENLLVFPPDANGQSMNLGEDDVMLDLGVSSAWDVATRYHEFRALPSVRADEKLGDHLRKLSARAVLERARAVLGSVVRPVSHRIAPADEIPPQAIQPEIDLEETLENSPLAAYGKTPASVHDLWIEYQLHRRQAVILSVDTSLSMTGEKLALTAVAIAVVLLQFPEDPLGIVAFENQAKILKHPSERITVDELIERFLDVPAQGYTHLEAGMRAALRLVRETRGLGDRPSSTVLLTDGKYTAGKDPAYLAPRFPHLVVMKMGNERASRDLCRELAKKGHGALREVGDLDALPEVMYGVVKDLLRGRSWS